LSVGEARRVEQPLPVSLFVAQRLSEKGWSWGYGLGAGVPASAGVWPEPAEAGTPGALSGVAGHPACRGTDANQLFRQSLIPMGCHSSSSRVHSMHHSSAARHI